MKTTLDPHESDLRKLWQIVMGLTALLAGGTLVSCNAHSNGTDHSSVGTAVSVQWVQVQENPPIYFPMGVPADHPTGYWDGMWISTEDQRGTRYFIPVRGVNGNALIEDAVDAMTPERRMKLGCRSEEAGYCGATEELKAAWRGLRGLVFVGKAMRN